MNLIVWRVVRTRVIRDGREFDANRLVVDFADVRIANGSSFAFHQNDYVTHGHLSEISMAHLDT